MQKNRAQSNKTENAVSAGHAATSLRTAAKPNTKTPRQPRLEHLHCTFFAMCACMHALKQVKGQYNTQKHAAAPEMKKRKMHNSHEPPQARATLTTSTQRHATCKIAHLAQFTTIHPVLAWTACPQRIQSVGTNFGRTSHAKSKLKNEHASHG